MTAITLEVCIDSSASLNAAVAGGADRVELCSALELGGLTPSNSLIDAATRCGIPAHAMIRPRAGDFNYSAQELEMMADDIRMCAKAGLQGVVIGAADEGRLDVAGLTMLCETATPMEITLHRVFDTLTDPLGAIETAIDIGFDRILTSGGAATADRGTGQIRRYVHHAGDRLAIMAGSGIGSENAKRIVAQTGVRDIHGSFGRIDVRPDPAIEKCGFSNGRRKITDAEIIRQVRLSLQEL